MIVWKLHVRFLYIKFIMSERKISHNSFSFYIVTTLYEIAILTLIQTFCYKLM